MNGPGPLSRKLACGGDAHSPMSSITLASYPAGHLVYREKDEKGLTNI